MAVSWLRLWHEMPNDPKWRTIARSAGQPIATVIAVYIHLLVIASNASERGRTQNMCCEDIASALDIESGQVESIIDAMQGRVLDGDQIKGWSKRQVEREDGSAARAKAWRELKKEEERTQTNANERKRTPDTDTDTDTDTEKIKESCSEPISSKLESVNQESGKIVFELPLNKKGTYHPVTENMILELSELYPAIDIMQQFRNMIGWLNSNQEKRKTARGVNSFINRWLSKAQDNSRYPTTGNASRSEVRIEGMKTAMVDFVQSTPIEQGYLPHEK